MIRTALLLGALALLLGGCRPLFTVNVYSGRRPGTDKWPVCERVVDRMIQCSTDPTFKGKLGRNRKKAVRACEREGKTLAAKCDRLTTCDAFVRCLAD